MIKLKLFGLGGQGVVTMGKVLCTAYSIHDGKFSKTIPLYGHERKGGAVLTDVIADEERILTNSFITSPDCVVVLAANSSPEELHMDIKNMKNALLFLNTSEPKQDYISEFRECWYTDATACSLAHINKNIPNIGMMGALAKAGYIPLEAVEKTISEFFGKSADTYKEILMEAYNDTKKK